MWCFCSLTKGYKLACITAVYNMCESVATGYDYDDDYIYATV